MTVLSRGARVRRGGRRPGWLLLTALLVLAIGASSALVFTDRAELLKLAVILALWAAVVAAFVSVIYRRQSDVDQARVRDLKLVYDLQLDREISARREYELTVESQLRRELASELRAQAADEVAALRMELAALRTNLEILFETELDQRPALETERATVGGYSEWSGTGDGAPADWVPSNRVTSVRAETTSSRAEESSIIDVPEEPVPRQSTVDTAEAYRGSHWSPTDDDRMEHERQRSRRQRHARGQEEAPAPSGQPRVDFSDAPAPRQPEPQHEPPFESQQPGRHPQPAAVSPQPGGENSWTAPYDDDSPNTDPSLNGRAPVRPPASESPKPSPPTEPAVQPTPRRGRHSSQNDADYEADEPDSAAQVQAPARHSTEPAEPEAHQTIDAAYETDIPESVPSPGTGSVARHRSAEAVTDDEGPPTGGQSVADLLARFQVEPAGGGRRRRRED